MIKLPKMMTLGTFTIFLNYDKTSDTSAVTKYLNMQNFALINTQFSNIEELVAS